MAPKSEKQQSPSTSADSIVPDAGGAPAASSSPDAESSAVEQAFYAFPVPAEYKDREGIELLMAACTLYGIDPDADALPVHLLDWKFYRGDRRRGVPDRILLVTAGGLKIAHPADDDTIDRLRRTFRLYRERKQKDGSVEIDILPMPEDLTLPTTTLTGQVESADHQYQRGYLREGGAAEAAKRAARLAANLPS
jgi:hypothetical protein